MEQALFHSWLVDGIVHTYLPVEIILGYLPKCLIKVS